MLPMFTFIHLRATSLRSVSWICHQTPKAYHCLFSKMPKLPSVSHMSVLPLLLILILPCNRKKLARLPAVPARYSTSMF
uniref:Uncharacterized protein n=1 Tax=Arundo donax TaxID=35708 RepID=A0A0A8YB59_ARUDO